MKRVLFTAVLCAALAGQALAIDLVVSNIKVIQTIQNGSLRLIGNNVTMVRVTVGISGAGGPVDNVDARLAVNINGTPMTGSPFPSFNGPLTLPLTPDENNINHTVNFVLVLPDAADVDFTVTVNPDGLVVETNTGNNTGTALNQNFQCRKKNVDMTYESVNYTPGGGEPSAVLIEPGIGDGFVRGIYKMGEWDYHKSPLPPIVWTQDINASASALLNTLRDRRLNQIPAAGYARPEFVYGWLPGNPYSGNGVAIGIPGDVAFGNTQTIRHQRTTAHEMGHLWGLSHNSTLIGTVGVDTERHLWDTERLGETFATSKNDIMVAGQLTNTAWVAPASFNRALDDARSACSADGGRPEMTVLRVSGVINHDTGVVTLDPIQRMAQAPVDVDRAEGPFDLIAYSGAGGVELYRVQVGTPRWESCGAEEDVTPSATSSIHATIPALFNNAEPNLITIVDRATGIVVARMERSANAPVIGFLPADNGGNRIEGELTLNWTGSDADGDSLTYTVLYSPDGGEAWLPIAVNLRSESFTFDTADVPSSRGNNAEFRLIATDGFNTVESNTSYPPAGPILGDPPQVYLLTTNDEFEFLKGAQIPFHAAAWDKEDRILLASRVVWRSNVDGQFGTGYLFTYGGLSVGRHTITVTGTDSEGLSTSKSIDITIKDRQLGGIPCNKINSFNASCKNSKVKAKLKFVDTSASGATVTFGIGGTPVSTTVNGKKAKASLCCFSGNTVVSLDQPSGCVNPITVNCN